MAFDPIIRNANPATDLVAIVPDTPFAQARGFFVGVGGAVVVKTPQGNTVTLTGCLAGTVYWIETNLIVAAGTTATNLVALI